MQSVELYQGDMTFHRNLPSLKYGRMYPSCSSVGTRIVVAGGCLKTPCNHHNNIDYADSVEVLDLASPFGWKKAPKLVTKMYRQVMVNVQSTPMMVGGYFFVPNLNRINMENYQGV